jgi:(1->4)-alpha-D-glucan 1-alpha-D-glucosylmutase
MFLSLAQTLLKMTAPGVPDTYQGTEFWDLSFVDPDNRRPVDFAERRSQLAELKAAESRDRIALLDELLTGWPDGRIKLYLTYKLLGFRRDHAGLFAEGEYIPLQAGGAMSERVCAFARRQNESWAVAIAPRLIGATVARGGMPLAEFWESSTLRMPPQAPEYWRDVISGETIAAKGNLLSLAKVFQHFPVALLVQKERVGARPAAEESAHAPSGQSIA